MPHQDGKVPKWVDQDAKAQKWAVYLKDKVRACKVTPLVFKSKALSDLSHEKELQWVA